MNFQAAGIMMAVALAGHSAHGAESGKLPNVTVPVYVSTGNEKLTVLLHAEDLARKMFRAAGVEIAWCNGIGSCRHSSGEIVVTLLDAAPPYFSSEGVARALPFEGTHIEVLYFRLKSLPRSLQPTLLAHVLVHEMTHIIQGLDRHSVSGLMKAHWDKDDYAALLQKPLPFTAEDIELMQMGLKQRLASYAGSKQ